jgi:hypothetical protein
MKGMRLVLVGVVAVGAALGGGSTERAQAGITTCMESTEKAFAEWGDDSNYTLAPNGSFEEGSTGWSLSGGARVVGRNNDLRPGSRSLALPQGASATSPAACVKLGDPASRFFLRNASGSGKVKVEITYRTVLGLFTVTTKLGETGAGPGWQPSPKYGHLLDNVLGTLALNGDLSASIQFRFTASGGNFEIDDLFVDPLVQA